jgi:hypothetical protein
MHDFEHDGYKIYDNGDGFQHGGGNFRLASYVAAKPNQAVSFAFCVNSIAIALHEVSPSDEELFQKARMAVVKKFDIGVVANLEEYTFEYNPEEGEFNEVTNASWWIKTPH